MIRIYKDDIQEKEYIPYFKRYFDLTPDGIDLLIGLTESKNELVNFFKNDVPADKLDFRYQEGKWTIKEVLQHIIDTERIFIYRCFRAARHDDTNMMGFEQDNYIEPSGANTKSINDLLGEFVVVRDSYISLIKSLKSADLEYSGSASNGPISARAISFLTWGHQIWHVDIIKERYL